MLIKYVLIFRLSHLHLPASLSTFSTIVIMNASVKPLTHSTKLAVVY